MEGDVILRCCCCCFVCGGWRFAAFWSWLCHAGNNIFFTSFLFYLILRCFLTKKEWFHSWRRQQKQKKKHDQQQEEQPATTRKSRIATARITRTTRTSTRIRRRKNTNIMIAWYQQKLQQQPKQKMLRSYHNCSILQYLSSSRNKSRKS